MKADSLVNLNHVLDDRGMAFEANPYGKYQSKGIKSCAPRTLSILYLMREVSVTVTRASARKAPRPNDPWIEIRGTLSPIEADEMIRANHTSRRNKSEAPELDAP